MSAGVSAKQSLPPTELVQFLGGVSSLDFTKAPLPDHIKDADQKAIKEFQADLRDTATGLLNSGLNKVFFSCIQKDDAKNVFSFLEVDFNRYINAEIPEPYDNNRCHVYASDTPYDYIESRTYARWNPTTTVLHTAIYCKSFTTLRTLFEHIAIDKLITMLNEQSLTEINDSGRQRPLQFACESANDSDFFIRALIVTISRIKLIAETAMKMAPRVKEDIDCLNKQVAAFIETQNGVPFKNPESLLQDLDKLCERREIFAKKNFMQGIREIFWANLITNNQKNAKALLVKYPDLTCTRATYPCDIQGFARLRFLTSTALTASSYPDQELFNQLLALPNRKDLIDSFNIVDDRYLSQDVALSRSRFASFTPLDWICTGSHPNAVKIDQFLGRLRQATLDIQPVERIAFQHLIVTPFTCQVQVDALQALVTSASLRSYTDLTSSEDLFTHIPVKELMPLIASYARECRSLFPHDVFFQCADIQALHTNCDFYEKAIEIFHTYGAQQSYDHLENINLHSLIRHYLGNVVEPYMVDTGIIPTHTRITLNELTRQFEFLFNQIPDSQWTERDAAHFIDKFYDDDIWATVRFLSRKPEIKRIIGLFLEKFPDLADQKYRKALLTEPASAPAGSGGSDGASAAATSAPKRKVKIIKRTFS